MSKKLLSLALALVMSLSLCIPAFALETSSESKDTDPYAELYADIYNQLEAQNALYLYDDFVQMLVPANDNYYPATRSTSNTSTSYDAPYGGVIHYFNDYTYQGDRGYKECTIVYMDKQDTKDYLADQYGNVGDLVGCVLGFVPGWIPTVIGLASLSNVVTNIYSKKSIKAAGGYAKVSTIYDSISGSSPTVAVGWDNYSQIVMNDYTARDVSVAIGM